MFALYEGAPAAQIVPKVSFFRCLEHAFASKALAPSFGTSI